MDFNKTFELYINGEKYDFEDNFSFYFHPTNFSNITLNNVVKSTNNNWPNITNIIDFKNEFTICELRQNNRTFFIGVVNDVGRLSLMPNKPKTFSIQISDFRKWLSLTKPINKIYFDKTPSFIVNDLISSLNEPKIGVGNLSFSTDSNFTIKAYNTTNKTLYQILKDVIGRQTNSTLYFTIENNIFKINYKSIEDFKTPHQIKIDPTNQDFLVNYKINDIVFDNETNNYYNYLSYTSDNIISKFLIFENNLLLNSDKVILLNNVGRIIEGQDKTYFYNEKTHDKIIPVIMNSEDAKEGKFCHLVWSENSNIIENKFVSNDYKLKICYQSKISQTLEAKNLEEIRRLQNISGTSGIVYKSEKFNDISESDDLLAAVKNDLAKFSKPNKILTLTSNAFIYNVLDTVEVVNISDDVNGIYIVSQIEGKVKSLGNNDVFKEFTYTLKQTTNFDTIENKFDNQSYRELSATTQNTIEDADTISSSVQIIFEDDNLSYDSLIYETVRL